MSFADEPPITHILLPKTAAVWYARPTKGIGSKPVSQRCRRESKRRRSGKNLSLLNIQEGKLSSYWRKAVLYIFCSCIYTRTHLFLPPII